MAFQEILRIGGGALALFLFLPLARDAIKTRGAGQSLATWLLWTALDTINAISIIQQRGNYPVAVGFAIGSTLMALLLVWLGRFRWGRFESVILALVLACLAAWAAAGPKAATLSATSAIFIAGLPGVVELWRAPSRRLAQLWGWYFVANVLSLLGGRAFTVAELFAPAVFAVFSALMFVAGRRPAPPQIVSCAVEKVD